MKIWTGAFWVQIQSITDIAIRNEHATFPETNAEHHWYLGTFDRRFSSADSNNFSRGKQFSSYHEWERFLVENFLPVLGRIFFVPSTN
jgi:hypothetical protein